MINDELHKARVEISDLAFVAMSKVILERTVLRFVARVRAHAFDAVDETTDKHSLQNVVASVLRLLPGDWRIPRLIVYPMLLLPEVYTRQESCDVVEAALLAANISVVGFLEVLRCPWRCAHRCVACCFQIQSERLPLPMRYPIGIATQFCQMHIPSTAKKRFA